VTFSKTRRACRAVRRDDGAGAKTSLSTSVDLSVRLSVHGVTVAGADASM